MAFDALVLKAIAGEINNKVVGRKLRLSKVFQLNGTDMLFYFQGHKEPLFVSIHPAGARLHFSSRHYSRPPSPSPFCMLLRKHLGGGLLTALRQPPLERVLYFDFIVKNEEGREVHKTLAAEIMGRHSNVVLLGSPDSEGNQVILGMLKPIPPSLNRFRTILPHHIYFPPPPQDKLHPFALNYGAFEQEMERFLGWAAGKALLDSLQGLNPFLAKEAAARANSTFICSESIPRLWEALQELLQVYDQDRWTPLLLHDGEEKPSDYTVIKPLQETGPRRSFESTSRMLDEFYEYREKVEGREKLRLFLSRQVSQALEKCRQKEKLQQAELERAREAGFYRLCGELILLNINRIPPEKAEITVENIIEGKKGEMINIPLDPSLSPSQNAQRYFKKYRKKRQGIKKIGAQLQRRKNESRYLESVLFPLENAGLEELKEIKEELVETGYLPPEKKPRPSAKTGPVNLLKCTSTSGEEIYVGRNNRQNDYLTLSFAAKSDYWLHVRDMPGAHVVIRSDAPDKETIKEAALLAAYFSRGAYSSNVPVDYTRVKNVRRIPGSGPGMVTYTNYRTVYVTPEPEAVQKLFKLQRR